MKRLENTKLYQLDKDMNTIPRVWRRKKQGKQSARLLIKCGCCEQKFHIFYDEKGDTIDDLVEINGVCASKDQWRQIFKEVGILD